MEGHFLVRQIYEDEVTYNIVGAAERVLSKSCQIKSSDSIIIITIIRRKFNEHKWAEVPANLLLEKFGEKFLDFCQDSGYDRILQVLGATPRDFLQVFPLFPFFSGYSLIQLTRPLFVHGHCRIWTPFTIIWPPVKKTKNQKSIISIIDCWKYSFWTIHSLSRNESAVFPLHGRTWRFTHFTLLLRSSRSWIDRHRHRQCTTQSFDLTLNKWTYPRLFY
jgi:hypothetical protein